MSGNASARSRPMIELAVLLLAGLLAAPAAGRDCYPWREDVCPGDWPLARHDLGGSGSTRLRTAAAVAARGFTYQPLTVVSGYRPGMTLWSAPALGLVGGRAVVVVGGHDHRLVVLDAASGEALWSYTTGGGIYATPIIWTPPRGATVVAAGSSDGSVYLLRAASGERLWSRPLVEYRPTLGDCRLSSPTLGLVRERPALLVGYWCWDRSLAGSQQQGGLAALDCEDGRELWRVEFLDNRVNDPLYLPAEKLVVVSSADGNLRALRAADGSLAWQRRESEPIRADPVAWRGPDGNWLLAVGSNFGKLRCLRAADGREQWSHAAGHWITGGAALIEREQPLLVFGSFANQVRALRAADGSAAWSLPVGGPVHASPALVQRGGGQAVFSALDDTLFGVAAADGTLLWSLPTGTPVWQGVPLGESLWSSPTTAEINGRWMVYLGSAAGPLLAIALDRAEQAQRGRPWSNRDFWLTMLAVLVGTATLARWLSRRRVA